MGIPIFRFGRQRLSLKTESVCGSRTFGNADIDLDVKQLCKCCRMSRLFEDKLSWVITIGNFNSTGNCK